MQLILLKYQRQKWKLIIYVLIAMILLIVLIIAALFSQLNQSNCNHSTSQVQLNSKDMSTNAKNIYKHWKKQYGATPQATAGILGALQLESNLNPKAINSNSGAIGLAQWLADRKIKLGRLAQQENKDITNLGLQLQYLDQELKGAYHSNQAIFKYTSVHAATKAWIMNFEGLSKNPEQWYLNKRNSYADHWYAIIGTNDPFAGNEMNDASQTIKQLDCANTNYEYSSRAIVRMAKSMKGYFYYKQSHPSNDLGNNLKKPNKNGGTDCSGFVWLVLNSAGYKVPVRMNWFTGTMEQDAKRQQRWLRVINKHDAKAGDVVIVNQGTGISNDGHTALLLSKWKGKDTKIIEEGGIDDRVNESTFGEAFLDLLDAGNITLARPNKN
ncbi:phage tail tip lysozyme [Apilactobacillus quenuiae]|uniref:phage tail tip lysozyme n=1 Tax=Apilactobacillus quenuiae TaxID=2008377 RepID=UPI000D0172FD|nr:phage tail tip lysozyme [Apilactobacillus quenuiae]